MKPEEALAASYEAVAATWHPDRNGAQTPENTSAKNSYLAWWRCRAGHEWQEIVATRTGMPAWKRGDRAACRVCVGYHVIVSFDCGHTTEARAEFAEPERGCPACRKVRWAAIEEQLHEQRRASSATGKKLYAESGERAQALVDALEVPDVPAPLAAEWRRTAVHALRLAVVAQEGFGRDGAITAALAAQRRAAASLLPSDVALQAAIAAGEPVTVTGRAHWPVGWQHHLYTADNTKPVQDDALVEQLHTVLTAQVAALVDRFGRARQLAKADVTAVLTGTIVEWARAQRTPGVLGWNAYRELSLPVAPAGSTRFGRIDLTVMRPVGPDLVVEIDSTHAERNLAKLAFARDAGAVVVWVRWHGGRVESPLGVPVIDLVDATRGLAA
jgi:hypothetical protein